MAVLFVDSRAGQPAKGGSTGLVQGRLRIYIAWRFGYGKGIGQVGLTYPLKRGLGAAIAAILVKVSLAAAAIP